MKPRLLLPLFVLAVSTASAQDRPTTTDVITVVGHTMTTANTNYNAQPALVSAAIPGEAWDSRQWDLTDQLNGNAQDSVEASVFVFRIALVPGDGSYFDVPVPLLMALAYDPVHVVRGSKTGNFQAVSSEGHLVTVAYTLDSAFDAVTHQLSYSMAAYASVTPAVPVAVTSVTGAATLWVIGVAGFFFGWFLFKPLVKQ
jgi:hypothetical protein